MPQQITVRKATISDAPALAPFAGTAFWDTYRDIDAPEDIARYVAQHFAVEELARVIGESRTTTLLAETNDAIAGYAILTWSEAPTCVEGVNPIELARFYLGASFLGQGHGFKLMRTAHEEARHQGAGTIWLGVYDRNRRAIRFYERFGFTRVGGKEFLFGGKIYIDPVYATSVREDVGLHAQVTNPRRQAP